MGGIRLRTKFLLSMVVVSAALTFTTLLVVRHTVQQEVRLGIQHDLENSVSAFHNFQQQREITLERSAALLADLPNVRALMNPLAIQQPSRTHRVTYGNWRAATCCCWPILRQGDGAARPLRRRSRFVRPGFLPNRDLARQRRGTGGTSKGTSTKFSSRIFILVQRAGARFWDTCCWVIEIDDRVAHDLSRVAASEVAFRYGD